MHYNGTADALQLVWIAARSSLREVCEEVTIQALADRSLPEAVTGRVHDDAWQPH